MDRGFKVSVIMTDEAKRFITPLTLSSLCQEKVYSEMFEETIPWEENHIPLGEKADCLVIAPATANIIGKIAGGIADCLLSCTVISTDAPIIIAPAMNFRMYKNVAVQANINTLKSRGVKFVGPIKGKMACGSVGEGHLAEVDEIVKAVVAAVK